MRNIEWSSWSAAVRIMTVVCAVALSTNAAAQESTHELATASRARHVALATDIAAASAKRRPISAKYEYEDGKLQLSVYTERRAHSPRSSSITGRGTSARPRRSPPAMI